MQSAGTSRPYLGKVISCQVIPYGTGNLAVYIGQEIDPLVGGVIIWRMFPPVARSVSAPFNSP